MGDYPTSGLKCFPWEITGTEGLLINAFDFTRPKYFAEISNGWNLRKDLKFKTGPVVIDSGAYYFRKHEEVSVRPEEILALQAKSQADVAVVLDHPFPPDAKDKARRITTTLNNTRRMFAAHSQGELTIEIMPVVHGHSGQALRGCLRRLDRIAREHEVRHIDKVGIGSVAPLAQKGMVRLAGEIILEVRRKLPDTHLHCFSMGSALLMLLAFYCGADSVDSQSWILSAAFKYAQLPGEYGTRLARREYKTAKDFRNARLEFAAKLLNLAKDHGFSVKDWSSGSPFEIDTKSACEDYTELLTDYKFNENLHNRACHNLWVFNHEVRKARQAIRESQLEVFVESRLTGSRYYQAFLNAKKLKHKMKKMGL